MILYMGKKVTANELAKLLIVDKGAVSLEYWEEFVENDEPESYLALTKKEKLSINIALERQFERVCIFLGIDNINKKRGLDEY